MQISPGDILEVTTERLTYGGEAIARYQGLAIFIPFAAPQERLLIQITEKKKNYARARIKKVLSPSPARIEPFCQYFGRCGGCQFQHVDYQTQLNEKVGFIRDALKRIGGINWQKEIPIRSAKEYGYRLRAQIKVDYDDNDHLVIGFHQANSHQLCDIESCPVLLPQLNDLLARTRSALKGQSEILTSEVDLATDGLKARTEPQFFDFHTDDLEIEIGETKYRFSPSVFFQGNFLLLEEFVNAVTQSESGDFALDLYSGVGLFSLPLAQKFKTVVGVESNLDAYDYAAQNALLNHRTNVNFYNQKANDWLDGFFDKGNLPTPDLVVLDPPRAGAIDCLDQLIRLNAPKITYVSCDPTTLARDLKSLLSNHYQLEQIVALDLFPQTFHIETIAFLERVA
ncbi:MAG: class I SAM-dependent RNA methyltransferase [Acidobacteriota bacterium]